MVQTPRPRSWTRSALLVAVVLALAAHVLACSSSDDVPAPTPSGDACSAATRSTARDGAVSFRANVVPIFERSCAFASCHGSSSANNGVFLGKAAPDLVHAALVGARSPRFSQVLVTPGSPEASFLLRKLDGDLCGLDCGEGGCGATMPKGNPSLPESSRREIAAWIGQGAKND